LETLPKLAAAGAAAYDSLGNILAAEQRQARRLLDLEDRAKEARFS
jgi:hypothetical protein